MRVGVVSYELEGEATGVGRYLAGLLSGVAELQVGWEWVLFFQGEPFRHPCEGLPGVEARFGRDRGRVVVWEQWRLPALLRRAGLDLLFSPSYSLPPLGGIPGVVTLHDLSFEHLPREFSFRERWRRRILARLAARRAARVLVDTARVGQEVHERLQVPRERIGVVPLGVSRPGGGAEGGDHRPGASAGGGVAQVLAGLGIEPPYALFLGTLFERRQPRLLLDVFTSLAWERAGLTLVLAGANRLRRPQDLERWIAERGLAAQVRQLGYVGEEEVWALYRGAELTFYLSGYEGFGLPPLESLACGTPAVVGPGTALDELWPEYPYRCPRLDLAAVFPVAMRALERGEERRQAVEEGIERMGRLTWRRAAKTFLAELEKAVRR